MTTDKHYHMCDLVVEGHRVHIAAHLLKANQDLTNGNSFHCVKDEPQRTINISDRCVLKFVQMEKALFEAQERQTEEMAGLETAFPCVPTHINPRLAVFLQCFDTVSLVTKRAVKKSQQ